MILDWHKIWSRYEELEEQFAVGNTDEDTLWQAIGEQVNVNDDYRLQIDEMWNQMLEWYVGEETEDGIDYDLSFEDKLELQGVMQGAVELALRLQGRGFNLK